MAWIELTHPSVLSSVAHGAGGAVVLVASAAAACIALVMRHTSGDGSPAGADAPKPEHNPAPDASPASDAAAVPPAHDPNRPAGEEEPVVEPGQRLVSPCCVQYTMEMLDSINTPLWVGGEEGMCSFANKAWRDLRGTFFGDELGDGWLEGVHPEDRTRLSEEHARAVAEKRGYEIEYRLQRADCVYTDVRQSAVPCVYGPSKKFFLVCTCFVLSESKSASGDDPESMLRRLPVPVVKRRADGMCGVAFLNERSTQLVGMPASIPPAVAGEAFDSMIHPDDLQNVRKALRTAVSSGVAYWVEYRLIDAKDQMRFITERGDAMKDRQGRIIGLEGVLVDETEKRLAEDSLRRFTDDLFEVKSVLEAQTVELASRNAALDEARRAAENATRSRTDVLANISHEIRTPLTAVLGFAELAADHTLSPSTREEAMRTIRQNGEHLLALVDDVFDLSKIEAGRMTIEQGVAAPFHAVEEAREAAQARARAKGVELRVVCDWPLPASVPCDPVRLRQILVNLVGNAVKFTDKGAVTLRVARAAGAILFEVTDTGIGIASDQIPRLFQPFVQADGTMTRKYGGTGLGLAISQKLAALMGGSITVRSELGKGSVFTLELPCPADAALIGSLSQAPASTEVRTPEAALGATLRGARVLLAEDGPDNQRLIGFVLRKAGAALELATTGVQAVEAVVTAERTGNPYQLVLMDMQMPDLDGYGAVGAIRQCGIRTPVIALTAHALAGDREKCLDAGCDDYLTKPIDRTALLNTCVAWLGNTKSRAA
jgi:signal transduction histidine kinase/ActR/RegA family two-component response regulator